MLVLPSLAIVRDELAEIRLAGDVRQWLEGQDTNRHKGIHASDLLDPRRAYWQRVDPRPLTERQVWFFTIGRVLHTLIESAASTTHDPTNADAGTHEAYGILFSPDILREEQPIEIKTSRAQYEPHPDFLQEDLHNYLEQLCIYMVLTGSLRGSLWILYISLKDETNRTAPDIRCYSVSLTKQQADELKQQILHTKQKLDKALTERNHTLLPLCRAWLCGPEGCVWWTRCKPETRFPETNRKRWPK